MAQTAILFAETVFKVPVIQFGFGSRLCESISSTRPTMISACRAMPAARTLSANSFKRVRITFSPGWLA